MTGDKRLHGDHLGHGRPEGRLRQEADDLAVECGIGERFNGGRVGRWLKLGGTGGLKQVPLDFTGGAGVEFGRAQGGFARIIQKQGSNTHEGVAEFYYRSALFDGSGANDFTDTAEPDFKWVQPAVQFSGPIVKDRLWYRVSLETRDIDQPINTGNGIESINFSEQTQDLQVTWQASPRNKLALQYRANSLVSA